MRVNKYDLFQKAAIEINAQLTRFVYREEISEREAAILATAQAKSLVDEIEKFISASGDDWKPVQSHRADPGRYCHYECGPLNENEVPQRTPSVPKTEETGG